MMRCFIVRFTLTRLSSDFDGIKKELIVFDIEAFRGWRQQRDYSFEQVRSELARCEVQWSITFRRIVSFVVKFLRPLTNDVLKASEVASSTRFAAFVRGKGTTDDNDERERRRLEKVGQVLKEWRRRRCYGMTEVLPRLFVGSMGDATDVEQLLANKITDVVSVHTLSRPTAAVDSLNVMHLRVSDQPEVNIADHFDDAISFIHTARINNRSVLVHCLAGVSRSVCIVAAYILTVTNMSYANTLAYLANKRPCANPNFGFRMQLIKYAEKKACAERLRLQNRFGVKCCQLQQIEDEAALSKSGIVALPILCKTESEKTLPDVAPLLSSAAPRSHRDTTDDHAICRRATHKKAASSDCLLSSPRKLKPRDMAFIWRISELAYIDQ